MLSLLLGTLRLRWPALLGTLAILTLGTAIVGANANLLDGGIRHEHSDLISLSAVFGGLTAMLMVTIVAVIFSLSMAQRRSEISLGRAIGVSPGQLRWLVTLETLILGVIGSVAGLSLAKQLTVHIFSLAVDAGIVPGGLPVVIRWLQSSISAAVGLVASLAAGLVAVHRWARLSPAEGLAGRHDGYDDMTHSRAVGASVIFTGALALSVVTLTVMEGPVASATAAPAVFLWTAGAALVAKVILRPLFYAMASLAGRLGVPGSLASSGVIARQSALVPVSVSVMLAVAPVLSLITMELAIHADAGGGGTPDVGGIVNQLLVGLIAAYAFVSLANAAALWVLGTRNEATTLRVLGGTPSLTATVLLTELFTALVAGKVLGLSIAVAATLPFLIALREPLTLPAGTETVTGWVLGISLMVTIMVGGPLVAWAVHRPLTSMTDTN